MKLIIILTLISTFCIAQTPIDDFNKVMDEYNEAYTSTDDPEKQKEINEKYDKLITEAQEVLEKALEEQIQKEFDQIRKEEEEFVIPEEVDFGEKITSKTSEKIYDSLIKSNAKNILKDTNLNDWMNFIDEYEVGIDIEGMDQGEVIDVLIKWRKSN